MRRGEEKASGREEGTLKEKRVYGREAGEGGEENRG
jgi:hypothetical protein